MRPTRTNQRQQGFSLIEAVVALAIIGLVMSVFYRAVGGSYGMQAHTSQLAQSIELARSQLDAVDTMAPAETGTSAGIYPNGFRWRLTISPLPDWADQPRPSPAYWLVLSVSDRRGRQVLQLETSRASGVMP